MRGAREGKEREGKRNVAVVAGRVVESADTYPLKDSEGQKDI